MIVWLGVKGNWTLPDEMLKKGDLETYYLVQ